MKKKLGFKIWLWIILLILSLFSIFISSNGITFLQKGVLITNVNQTSPAFESGFRTGQIITSINGNSIQGISDFSKYTSDIFSSQKEKKTIFKTKKLEIIYYSNQTPDMTISNIKKTNLETGLDLSGGARALVKAKDYELTKTDLNDLTEILRNRFDVYGLKEVSIVPVSDLLGNNYIKIEMAGVTRGNLKDLVESQGKFEAKIGNQTVFVGGDKDIASVSNNAQDSYISCPEQTYCTFRFGITLSPEAAKKHSKITSNMSLNETNPEYLEKPLDLYLDGSLVSSLQIGKGLKGLETTQISISGSEKGGDSDESYKNAKAEMTRLKAVLRTGSLPYKLEIVKIDTISPTLGNDFVRFILLAGLAALIAASIVIFVRYKNIKASLAVILFSFSEIVIILGVASLIKWSLDLASIAGILATIGTGFDDQIVILDESKTKTQLSLKQKLKRAFIIIMGSYFTSLASLLPLISAGAGLLKGFAITTIIGISVGVFITRPAFSKIVKRIEE